MVNHRFAAFAACLVMSGLSIAAENAPVELANDTLRVAVEPGGKTLTIRPARGDAKGIERVRLCAEIVGASGVTVRSVEHQDALGTARAAVEVSSDRGVQRVWVYPDSPFVFTRATLRATGPADEEAYKTITPVSFDYATSEKTRLFGSDGLAKPGQGKPSYVFLAAAEPGTNHGMVCGFITHDRASGIVDAKAKGGSFTVDGRSEYGVPPLRGHKEERGETFVIGLFDDARLGLEQFADVTAKANHVKLRDPMSGYSTWYHARALDEKRMAELSDWCKKNRLDEYGLNFLQIDDQWQVGRRDFTTHKTGENATYPNGMKATAHNIAKNGFVPGLWLTPFGWQGRDFQDDKPSPNKTVLKDHPDWFVKRTDGSIYWVRWAGDCLDMTNPEAREFLKGVIHRMVDDWGYRLLKIDGLWAGMAVKILYPSPEYRDDGIGDAVFFDKTKTNQEVYRDGLRLVRDASGGQAKTFILGCNIAQNMRTMGGSIGLVDSMRIGPDIKADWSAVVRCARPAGWLYFWNGRVWWNDPDCLMLREPLTLEMGRAWGSFIGLSGQLHLVSEWLPGLPPERLDVLKRTIPNHRQTTARPVDLFEHEMPNVWHVSRTDGDDRRDVVGVFNWAPPPASASRPTAATGQEEPVAADTPSSSGARRGATAGPLRATIDPKTLGLPDGKYAAFDFWANRFLPVIDGPTTVEVPAGSCTVIALVKTGDRPQIVSTSRHVSQGMVDLADVRWDAGAGVLRGTSKVVGGDPYELRVATAGWKLDSAKSPDADGETTATPDGDNLRVTINAAKTATVSWELKFARPSH